MSLRLVRLPSGRWTLVAVPGAQHISRSNAAPYQDTARGDSLEHLSAALVRDEREAS
jgi:hypothetical protein